MTTDTITMHNIDDERAVGICFTKGSYLIVIQRTMTTFRFTSELVLTKEVAKKLAELIRESEVQP